MENESAQVLQTAMRGQLASRLVNTGQLVKAGRVMSPVGKAGGFSQQAEGCREGGGALGQGSAWQQTPPRQEGAQAGLGRCSSCGCVREDTELVQALRAEAAAREAEKAAELRRLDEDFQAEVEEGLATFVELVKEKEKSKAAGEEVAKLRGQLGQAHEDASQLRVQLAARLAEAEGEDRGVARRYDPAEQWSEAWVRRPCAEHASTATGRLSAAGIGSMRGLRGLGG